jgi:hypothetical protein
MVVETKSGRSAGRGQSGQALMEFMLLLPSIVILVVVLLRTNSAIQVSINNQQYARAQALWLAFNSPVYPELRHRVKNFQLGSKMANQMVIGVSQNSFPDEGDQVYQPEATIQNISRKPAGAGGSDEPQIEPDARAKVRVRTTVSLCTQPNVAGGGALLPLTPSDPFTPTASWNLRDDVRIDYCRRPPT